MFLLLSMHVFTVDNFCFFYQDIKELVLTDNPDTKQNNGAVKGDGNFIDTSRSDYICPVVGIGMSGKYRCVYLFNVHITCFSTHS